MLLWPEAAPSRGWEAPGLLYSHLLPEFLWHLENKGRIHLLKYQHPPEVLLLRHCFSMVQLLYHSQCEQMHLLNHHHKDLKTRINISKHGGWLFVPGKKKKTKPNKMQHTMDFKIPFNLSHRLIVEAFLSTHSYLYFSFWMLHQELCNTQNLLVVLWIPLLFWVLQQVG